MVQEDILFNTRQASEFTGIKVSRLEQDRVSGRLGIPFHKVGRSVYYKKSCLQAYLDGLTPFTNTSQADEHMK